jgi:hypothetical protein
VTGFASIETALKAMKLGAFDYIRKPFRLDQLRETLRLVDQEREYESAPESRHDPIREAGAIASTGEHEVLLIGDRRPPDSPHLHFEPLDPHNLAELEARIDYFVTEHSNASVVLSGVERLLDAYRLEDVEALLERVRIRLDGHGPLRVGFNPKRLPPAAAAVLGSAVAPGATHETLEALANPIRRRVLFRLSEAPTGFHEAMEAARLDDSPKMAFHLRKLLDAGLVRHERETYRLTARGRAGVRLLVESAFLPPVGGAGNLAFLGTNTGKPGTR